VFEYVDVTDDPSAPRHAAISEAMISEAVKLGFVDVGFIAAMVQGSSRNHPIVSRVMKSASGETLLSITRFRGRENISLKTLFEDGSIVSTEQRPRGLEGMLIARGAAVAPHHAYDLATFPVGDIASLLAIHAARIERMTQSGRTPVPGDLRVHLAVRRRYREIANPRVARQHAFAGTLSKATFVIVVAGGVFASLALRPTLGNGALFVALLGLLAGAAAALVAFLVGLAVLSPFIAKDVAAPAPRPAADLLALADEVPRGRIAQMIDHESGADPDDDESSVTDVRPAQSRNAPIHVPAADLVRLRRRDTIVSLANALVLPGVGFALIRVLGTAGTTAAFGAIACIDAAIFFVMQKSRLDLLRARFVPDLVAAENGLVVPSGLRWIYAGVGIIALVVARRSIAAGIEPAPGWLFAEWAALAALFLFAAWRGARKRHERLVGT
jgi:hypothetical protein